MTAGLNLNKEKVINVGKIVIMVGGILLLLITLTLLWASLPELKLTGSAHKRAFMSKQYFHDDVTGMCYIIIADRLSRGIALVPCEKVPPDLLHHLRGNGTADAIPYRLESLKK
jgi:hypothetical protein